MDIEPKKPEMDAWNLHDSGDNNCQSFAEHIRDIFEYGLRISNTDSQFIFSTMPIANLTEMDQLIQDPDSTETDSLMELLYFPDESVQICLEDRIESAHFQAHDMDTILSHLMAMESDTHILSPPGQLLTTLPTPRSGARAFLQRLNLYRNLAPELIQAIEAAVDPEAATKYKVWLRNMTREPGKRDTQFLTRLFSYLAPHYQPRDRLIEFALRFLEETPADVELLQGLIQYKQRCLQHIQRLDRFESQRRSHNFETRVALGIREPHDDKQVLMQKVVLLDEIGLAIYNRNI